MTSELPARIVFGSVSDWISDDLYVARIPSGILSEAPLLEVLAKELRFPDYFGNNWDALYDCLCDLQWIQNQSILIAHRDLPLADDAEALRRYLGTLRDAVLDWEDASERVSPHHTLIVLFNPTDRDRVQRVLAD